jgi:hypothetical protein
MARSNSTVRAVAVAVAAVAAVALAPAPASAAPKPTATMTFDGPITSVERQGKRCSYEGDLAITSEIRGRDVEGEVQARWTSRCEPELVVGVVVSGIADVRFNRFASSAGGSPNVLRFTGEATEWLVPLGFASSASGSPNVLRFQFRGFASQASGSPNV